VCFGILRGERHGGHASCASNGGSCLRLHRGVRVGERAARSIDTGLVCRKRLQKSGVATVPARSRGADRHPQDWRAVAGASTLTSEESFSPEE
jgi:hypothetical protein